MDINWGTFWAIAAVVGVLAIAWFLDKLVKAWREGDPDRHNF